MDQGIKGEKVVEVLDRIMAERGALTSIRVDHSPEFASKALDRWAYEQKVTLDVSRSGQPAYNAYVESFKGRRSKVSASFLFSRLSNWLLHGDLKVSWRARGSTSSNTDKSSDTIGRKRVAE